MRISDWSSDVCSSDLLADPCFPDPQLHIPLADFDADTLLDAVRGATQPDRQIIEVDCVCIRLLTSLRIDGLREIALAIQQPDCHERHTEIADRLAMIASKNAQATGIDRQALVQAELSAEVRDQIVTPA